MISPLKNFAIVEEGKAFRSAQPMYNYEYLWVANKLGLKTMINLRGELNHDKKFCEKLSIKEITYDIKDHYPPTIQDCLDFMEVLNDGRNYPLLFHCEHGQGRTSTFSVLYSLHCGLTLDEALEKERVEYDYTFKHQCQLDVLHEFIKIYTYIKSN